MDLNQLFFCLVQLTPLHKHLAAFPDLSSHEDENVKASRWSTGVSIHTTNA